MPGFSNSLCYFYVIDAIRIRYFNSNMVEERTTMFIHSATSSKVSRFVSSLEISVTEYQTYNICNFATTYDRQTAKKLAQPIHPSIATAKPLEPFQFAFCSERKYVTSKPEPEHETRVWPFPNPKTRVHRRNPGLEITTSTSTFRMLKHTNSYRQLNTVISVLLKYLICTTLQKQTRRHLGLISKQKRELTKFCIPQFLIFWFVFSPIRTDRRKYWKTTFYYVLLQLTVE